MSLGTLLKTHRTRLGLTLDEAAAAAGCSNAEARWYCMSREGMATLCTDEEDAKEVAAESFVLYPQNGPYRAVQMVDAAAVAAERERWAKKCDEVAAILRRDPDEKKQISAHMADWLAVELRA
jgi:hypothetical protein